MISQKQLDQFLITNKNDMCILQKTTSHKSIRVPPRWLNLYKQLNTNLYILARYTAHKLLNIEYEPDTKYSYAHNIPLYDYQKHIVNRVISHLNTSPHRSFLKLGTGYGKTRIGLCVMYTYIQPNKNKGLFIVPTVHIAKQIVDEHNLISDYKICIYNNKKDISEYDIVVSVINTARSKDIEFYKQFIIVICDEVHEYTSDCNKEVLWLSTNNQYVLGLSATPDTGKDLLPFIVGHIGHPISCDDIPKQKYKVNVNIIKYKCENEYSIPVLNDNGIVNTMSTIVHILSDKTRISLCVSEIELLYNMHKNIKLAESHNLIDKTGKLIHKHHIFAFAETRDFLIVIRDELKKINILDVSVETEDDGVSVLRGGITDKDLSEAVNSRIILTTYGYSRRGVSYNNYTALIMMSPRRAEYSVNQILGRICRIGGPKDVVRCVIDIHDAGTALRSQINNRLKVYNENEYNIIHKNNKISEYTGSVDISCKK